MPNESGFVLNGATAVVEPFDDVTQHAAIDRIPIGDDLAQFIPSYVVQTFKKYFGTARLELRSIKVLHSHLTDSNIDPIEVVVPYIVLSSEAMDNPLKLKVLKDYFRLNNIIVEKIKST